MFNAFCGVPFNGFGFQNGFNNTFNGYTPSYNGFPGAFPGQFFGGFTNGFGQPGFTGSWNTPSNGFNSFGGFDWNAFAAGCAYGCSNTAAWFNGQANWNTPNTNGANPVNPYGFAYPFGFNRSNGQPVNGQQAA